MRLLLDSTFLIDHLRGQAEAVDRLADIVANGDEPIVTEIVVCEVRAGLLADAERHLVALLEPMELVQADPGTAMRAGRWRAELRAAGRTLSLADSLIAAAADSMGATVLTRNVRDFSLTPVPVETY